jgi:glucose-6-phosphate 1-dehydrogenase
MIDSKTGKKIIVHVDKKYGPFIRVSTYDDAGALEDVLDDHYHVLYWMTTPEELKDYGGHEYYFGNAASQEKIQKILDEIVFN